MKTQAEPIRVVVAGAGSELKAVTEVVTEEITLDGVRESFSQTAPIDYSGLYTYLKEQKTVEVEVLLELDPDIQPVEKEEREIPES